MARARLAETVGTGAVQEGPPLDSEWLETKTRGELEALLTEADRVIRQRTRGTPFRSLLFSWPIGLGRRTSALTCVYFPLNRPRSCCERREVSLGGEQLAPDASRLARDALAR